MVIDRHSEIAAAVIGGPFVGAHDVIFLIPRIMAVLPLLLSIFLRLPRRFRVAEKPPSAELRAIIAFASRDVASPPRSRDL
jgi:hypothetical protein